MGSMESNISSGGTMHNQLSRVGTNGPKIETDPSEIGEELLCPLGAGNWLNFSSLLGTGED
jgi:hypothetical protein